MDSFVFFWIFLNFSEFFGFFEILDFFGFFWLLLKVTEVTTDHQKLPKIVPNKYKKKLIFAHKKASA